MTTKKARDLTDGDLVDLEQHPDFDRFDESTQTVAEHEYARVGDEDGPHVWEPDGTFLLCTDQGVFVTDPDAPFDVEGVNS